MERLISEEQFLRTWRGCVRAAVTTIEDCLTPCWRVKIIT